MLNLAALTQMTQNNTEQDVKENRTKLHSKENNTNKIDLERPLQCSKLSSKTLCAALNFIGKIRGKFELRYLNLSSLNIISLVISTYLHSVSPLDKLSWKLFKLARNWEINWWSGQLINNWSIGDRSSWKSGPDRFSAGSGLTSDRPVRNETRSSCWQKHSFMGRLFLREEELRIANSNCRWDISCYLKRRLFFNQAVRRWERARLQILLSLYSHHDFKCQLNKSI